jgi:hypothetical protein
MDCPGPSIKNVEDREAGDEGMLDDMLQPEITISQ